MVRSDDGSGLGNVDSVSSRCRGFHASTVTIGAVVWVGMRDESMRDGRIVLDRRRALRATAGVTASALGVSTLAGTAAAGGDDGDYTAPSDYPLISTRGHFDDDGDYTDAGGTYNYDGEGDWAKYTESWHDELIVFVHGWNVDAASAPDAAYTAELALENNGTDETTVGFTWDSDLDWWTAVDVAKHNGIKLAAWVSDHVDRGGDPLRVVAHSLGAQVAMSAVYNLAAWGYDNAIETVSFVGAAVPDQTASTADLYGDALADAVYSVSNFYKTDDAVLNWAYESAEWDTALGNEGIQDGLARPYNYQELNVSDVVPDHGSYYEPGEGCMPWVVDTF